MRREWTCSRCWCFVCVSVRRMEALRKAVATYEDLVVVHASQIGCVEGSIGGALAHLSLDGGQVHGKRAAGAAFLQPKPLARVRTHPGVGHVFLRLGLGLGCRAWVGSKTDASRAWATSGYGGLGLLGLYHDVVVLRHLRRAAGEGAGRGEAQLSRADWLRVVLTGVQHLELFAEIAAHHRLGSSGKWTAVAVVECLKYGVPPRSLARCG